MVNKFIAEVDPDELALLIAEAVIGVVRPPNQTAKECMAHFPPEDRGRFINAAWAAAKYMTGTFNNAKPTN